ncbi:MAG: alginate lyase family protein [Arcicella sp.]|nr:alginate lyase family protein [Arcicella sp.]
MKTALLYFHTIIHLRPTQIYYQIFYKIRAGFRKITGFTYSQFVSVESHSITLKPSIPSNQSYFSEQNRFQFLNQSQIFSDNKINWNDEKTFGKLWAYNLNYFDFLNQENITKGEGLALIQAYIREGQNLKTGFESYPISLRGINWIKFLSKYQIQDIEIDGFLMAQYIRLVDNLEYHVMANHLLENAFSLLFGGYYFRNQELLKVANKIFQKELPEQILADGGHFERSPMYHQIILFRLLDCLNLVRCNLTRSVGRLNSSPVERDFKQTNNLAAFIENRGVSFEQILTFYTKKMLNFLQNITFKNGDIPLVNDAAKNITTTTKQLFNYANQLNMKPQKSILSESGYRKFENANYELLIDVGNTAPDYQPAHAHCDTLSFVLYVHGKPFIVDTGTSTYENNEIRQKERSISAHNTVQIGNFEQSEIWSSFRVGRRAKAKILSENEYEITASHDGYKRIGIIHQRSYSIKNQAITIQDEIFGATQYLQKAYLHFHPNVEINVTGNVVETNFGKINFENVLEIQLSEYYFSEEFNKRTRSKMLTLIFEKHLTTTINIRPSA